MAENWTQRVDKSAEVRTAAAEIIGKKMADGISLPQRSLETRFDMDEAYKNRDQFKTAVISHTGNPMTDARDNALLESSAEVGKRLQRLWAALDAITKAGPSQDLREVTIAVKKEGFLRFGKDKLKALDIIKGEADDRSAANTAMKIYTLNTRLHRQLDNLHSASETNARALATARREAAAERDRWHLRSNALAELQVLVEKLAEKICAIAPDTGLDGERSGGRA